MASLVLGAAGASIGSSLLGGGFSLLGATITGAQIGGAIGSFIGTQIDQALMPGQHVTRNGPRLSDVNIQASTEGAPIPRLYGRVRVAGQLIWASQFKETPVTTTSGGGKGGGATVTETDYSYAISFAVGLCAGEATRVGRVWANGAPLDLAPLTTRFYGGSESQNADPLIAEIDGDTPAYRGLAYMVFEDLPLAAFGNRIPQLQFEVIRAIGHGNPASLENLLPGVALIPGAGEFVYATDAVTADDGQGGSTSQNVHGVSAPADIDASLDDLQALAPNLKTVSLVVGWFGDDLRAGSITIKPGVEALAKTTYPQSWSVNGVARADAHLVSRIAGIPAYGGTPSDESVVQAIQDLKARGLRVLFYPFLFMDIAAGNTLADPYGGAAQSAYPWRGRITCFPAPGQSGSPDKSAAAESQVANFFGTATAADFSVSGTSVAWTGGADWGWRRMVLHYAKLCAAAGGVDAFLIGSELRGLTRVRASASDYPAVAALKALAGDVRAILGPDAKLSYGADWSEYANHQTGDAPGAVLFNLDPLWCDANIDFIGIDNYLPLADWREGTAHRDYDAAHGPVSIYDPAYLAGNIRGGEDYDWYYASDADRDAQIRTPITDGAYGKPWVFRAKDFWNWWANAHYDRPLGSESAAPTGWTAQSKPIRFTELGCPAIDKGANQPNVFFDPKSSESAFPYYSRGTRDDLIQRRFLEAHLAFWQDSTNNPVSTVYGAPMLDSADIAVWCWDARPFPYFPALANVWGDSADYARGHWLNGRLGTVALADLVEALCADAGFSACDVSDLDGLVTGFAVTDTMSPRDAIAPLASAYFFDGVESQGVVKFLARGRAQPLAVAEDALVLPAGADAFSYSFTRAQETDLPQVSRITYIDSDHDYSQAGAEARRLIGGSSRVAGSAIPLVMDQGQAVAIGQRLLQDAWVMREAAQFSLPPSRIAADPADEILLQAGGRTHRLRITEIDDGAARAVQTVATDPSIYAQGSGPARAPALAQMPVQAGRAVLEFMDLPLLHESDKAWAPHLAAFAKPWPGQVLLLRSASDSAFALDTVLARPAILGVTLSDFYSGPTARWDNVGALYVQLYGGALSSADDLTVLGGANAIAVQNAAGQWEILQFADAVLLDTGKYKLSRLLRGQCGSEGAMGSPVAAGARMVLLDGAVLQSSLAQSQYALPFNYLWGPAGKAQSDPAWQSATRQFAGIGLRPFSVCHVGFVWDGADLAIAWMRRDRDPAADSWDQSEIPMSETREAYDLEILDADGAAVLRTYSGLTAPGAVYSAAQQAADFPTGLPNPLRVNIYQLSSVFGRGAVKSHALYTR